MPTTNNAATPPSSLSDAINMLMENPQIISAVASALGGATQDKEADSPPSASQVKEEAESEPKSPSPQAPPDLSSFASVLAPLASGLSGAHSSKPSQRESDTDRREALLCALKPYVSEGRRDAIDYIIRISRMSDILKTIQQ